MAGFISGKIGYWFGRIVIYFQDPAKLFPREVLLAKYAILSSELSALIDDVKLIEEELGKPNSGFEGDHDELELILAELKVKTDDFAAAYHKLTDAPGSFVIFTE